MNRTTQRVLAATLSLPVAIVLSYTPSATAATVLALEGTFQPSRTTQQAFSGQFCAQNTCRSLNNAPSPFDVTTGSRQLQTALDSTQGDVIVMGYSLGAASIYHRMREWEKNSGLAPDPQRVVLVVTFGNPENKFGGDQRKIANKGLPAVQPYQHLDVTMQYDSVADRPTRWGWYSLMNSAFARHSDYLRPSNINDPDNLIYRDPDGTTYMLIKADVLPMLKWRAWFTSDERMAELDAMYRPLIEADYDRPDYVEQGPGADWGNGNPPPSVTESGAEAEPGADEIESNEVTLATQSQSPDSADANRTAIPEIDRDDVDSSGDADGTPPSRGPSGNDDLDADDANEDLDVDDVDDVMDDGDDSLRVVSEAPPNRDADEVDRDTDGSAAAPDAD